MDLNQRLAWAAGLFEGEGNISLRANNRDKRTNEIEKNVSIIMQLAMTDEDVVRRFHDALLGLGGVTGPFYSTRKTISGNPLKPTWAWRTTSIDTCITIYSLLRPWLGDRRRATGDAALYKRYEYEVNSFHPNTVLHDFPEWITSGACTPAWL